MPYRLDHDEKLGVGVVTYSGLVTKEDFAAASVAGFELQKSHGVLGFLVNLEGTEMAATKLDIYNLPTKAYEQVGLDRRTRIAVVLPSAEKVQKAALFYEDASRNRGWKVRTFPDRAAALEWLQSPL